jgi:hypothetical protein
MNERGGGEVAYRRVMTADSIGVTSSKRENLIASWNFRDGQPARKNGWPKSRPPGVSKSSPLPAKPVKGYWPLTVLGRAAPWALGDRY